MNEPRAFVPPSRAQLLADLSWLLLSPPLLSDRAYPGLIQSFSEQERLSIRGWLEHLAGDGTLDASHFGIDRHLRLGRYAEKLMKYFLEHAPGFTLLAHSLALRNPELVNSTLGEIDFLLRKPDGSPWHWELAVKVFLCESMATRRDAGPVSPSHLHGPNRAETFDLKLDKLFHKQLSQPVPEIASLPGQVHWQRAAFAKGRIFYLHGEPLPAISSACSSTVIDDGHVRASFLDDAHPQGFWCEAADFGEVLRSHPHARARRLERLEWLSPKTQATLTGANAGFSADDALHLSSPTMICLMEDNIEITRGFVLPARNHRAGTHPA